MTLKVVLAVLLLFSSVVVAGLPASVHAQQQEGGTQAEEPEPDCD